MLGFQSSSSFYNLYLKKISSEWPQKTEIRARFPYQNTQTDSSGRVNVWMKEVGWKLACWFFFHVCQKPLIRCWDSRISKHTRKKHVSVRDLTLWWFQGVIFTELHSQWINCIFPGCLRFFFPNEQSNNIRNAGFEIVVISYSLFSRDSTLPKHYICSSVFSLFRSSIKSLQKRVNENEWNEHRGRK